MRVRQPACKRCFVEKLLAAFFAEFGIGEDILVNQFHRNFPAGKGIQRVVDFPRGAFADLPGQFVFA